ncbi:MAG: protein kinase, partial [Planctomycetota bacterium]|nr:protein kinase [Planctomycetota bacterium]
MNNKEVSVPELKNLDELLEWLQSPSVQLLVNKNPDAAQKLASHPHIKPLINEFLSASKHIKTATTTPPHSETDTLRFLTLSNPEDRAFIEQVIEFYKQRSVVIDESANGEKGASLESAKFETKEEGAETKELTSFGRYTNLRKLAEGGFGAVYIAYDPQLDRTVALKLLKLRTPAEIEHFESEARLAAKLRHPNIIPVHELGVLELPGMPAGATSQPYFTMDYIAGVTLRKLLDKNRSLSVRDTFEIILPVLDALHYAHTNGVIHRDIKPENIFIDKENRIYLGDFGVAKEVKGEGKVTASRIVGTPQYMSPEQAEGKVLDSRSDVWAVGVVLYECISGIRPFDSDTVYGVFKKIWNDDAKSLRAMNKKVDKDVETIVMRCLEKNPNNRYGSALELKEDMERYLRGELIKARPVGFVEKLYRKAKRNKIASLSILGVLVAGIIAGVFVWRQRIEHQREIIRREEEARVQREIELKQKREEARRLFEESSNAFNKGEYERAIELVSKSLTLVPDDSEALRLKSACDEKIAERREREERRKGAEEVLKRILMAATVEEKLKLYDEAVGVDPSYVSAYIAKGELLKNENRYEEAIAVFEKVIEVARKEEDRNGEAVGNFFIGLILLTQARGALTARGEETIYDREKSDKAFAYFEKAKELVPDVRNAYTLFIDAAKASKNKDYDRAIGLYGEALKLKSDFFEASVNCGYVKNNKGDYDGA